MKYKPQDRETKSFKVIELNEIYHQHHGFFSFMLGKRFRVVAVGKTSLKPHDSGGYANGISPICR